MNPSALHVPSSMASVVRQQLAHAVRGTLLVAYAAVLAACGGGEGASDEGTYFAVTGTKDVVGNPTITVCFDNVANLTADSADSTVVADRLARFYLIKGNYHVTSSTGHNCSVLPGSIKVTVDYYNNTILPWDRNGGGANSGGQTNNTNTNTNPGPATSEPSATAYVNWNGNANGAGVRDASNDLFGVRTSDRAVTQWPSETGLRGLTVNAQGQVVDEGVVTGYVGQIAVADGSTIAMFYCSNGAPMDILMSSNTWSTSCTGSSGGGMASAGNSGGTQRSFIEWSNSVNGTVVLDGNSERFQFYSDSRCLYSPDRNREYTNFCLPAGGNSLNFEGQPIVVGAGRATSGSGCVAVFTDGSGHIVDFYTDSSNQDRFSIDTTRTWTPC